MRLLTALTGVCLVAFALNAPAAEKSPATNSAPKLSPLLMDAEHKEGKSRDDWLKEREIIRKRWSNLIGEFPTTRAPLNAEAIGTVNLPDFTRQHVKYQIEDGVFTEAYLLSPTNARGKLPAIIVFHPTTWLHAKGVAGVDASYPEEKQQGPQLARRGYVVLCPRNFIFDEGTNFAAFKEATARMQQRHPNWTGIARMTFDAIRAVDYVESLPSADAHRIGCIGHSLGAKVALYAGAFDERYSAVVFRLKSSSTGILNIERKRQSVLSNKSARTPLLPL